jgi:TRAP-type uncharacterized transport system substrate-binding protein
MYAEKLPIWLRVVVVAGAVLLAGGAGLLGYRWYAKPTVLTLAAGSADGEAAKLVSQLEGKLLQSNAPVRIKLVPVPGALEAAKAFSTGQVDLAVVRGDGGELENARAVVVVAHLVVLLVAPPGSAWTDLSDIKRATIGVIGGPVNAKIVEVLTRNYNLSAAGVSFKELAPQDTRKALASKEVQAVLVVVPLSEKYLALLRGLFSQTGRAGPVLIGLGSAGAIAEREKAYESFDVPKGTLRGAPPIPSDDLTTLKTSLYLVARKDLDDQVAGDLAEALMNARRELLAENPLVGLMAAPDTDADAFMPIHPGAAAFFEGTRESFLDRWGNAIFLAPMVLGALASILAAAWKFLRAGELKPREEALDALYALGPRIREADGPADLDQIEVEIDRVLRAQRSRVEDNEQREVTAVNVAAHRLENLIHDRRIALASQQAAKPSA